MTSTQCRFRLAHASARFNEFDAAFHQCVLDAVDDALQCDRRDRLAVSFALDVSTPQLSITVADDDNNDTTRNANTVTVPLWHNVPCLGADSDFRETAAKKKRRLANVKPKSIKLCACVLLERSDLSEPHVLLTRRNAQMRVSPGAFVVPGGHFDHGDDADVIACALRELHEETGIVANRENAAIIAAFESVVPTSHFIILYVRVRATAAQIDRKNMLVPPKEVSQLVWMPRSRVAECIAYDLDDNARADLDAFEVPSSSRTRQRIIDRGCKRCDERHVCGDHLEQCKVSVATLVGDEDNEGIASGTRMLLQHWFDDTAKS